jgi:hypothetical protein
MRYETNLAEDLRAILADSKERVILAERRLAAEKESVSSDIERAARQHPSTYSYASDSGACYRKVGFRMREFEGAPMDLEGELTVGAGRDLEELIVMVLDRRHDGQAQVRFAKGNIHGRADYVYTDEAGRMVVVEIKATAAYGMKLAHRDGPKPEHLTQGMLGADAFGAPRVRLIYICRGRSDKGVPLVLDWTEDIDDQLVKDAHTDADAIKATIDEGYLPDRLYNGELIEDPASERWPCGWCAYAGVCRELPTSGVLLGGTDKLVVQLDEGGA